MPHVASETTTHALNRSHPLAARPTQPERAPATPFASLLDDSAAASGPPKQPAADANVNSARSDQSPQPGKTLKSSDGKAATVDDTGKAATVDDTAKAARVDDTGKTANKIDISDKIEPSDVVATTDKAVADSKAAAAAKLAKTTTTEDDTASDGEPAELATPIDAAATPPIDFAPVIKAADPTIAALPPIVVGTPMPSGGDAETSPPSPDVLAALHADTGKAADDPALAGRSAAALHGKAKLQVPAAHADEATTPHAHVAAADRQTATARVLDALSPDAATAAPKAAADSTPSNVLPAPVQTNLAVGANPAAVAPQAPHAAAIPLAGVAVEIAGKAAAGKNHFEIRLDPPELGRIEVRLAVDRDGNVTSRLIADRADTLDLLRRDASGLERALQDAGLKTAENGLQFSLRDQSAYRQQHSHAGDAAPIVPEDETLAAADAAPRSYGRLLGLGGGLDIHV